MPILKFSIFINSKNLSKILKIDIHRISLVSHNPVGGINLALAARKTLMSRYAVILSLYIFCTPFAFAQVKDRADTTVIRRIEEARMQTEKDTLPHAIPFLLPSDKFIPDDRLFGYLPWTYAPISRPVVFILPTYGFYPSVGFGLYSIQHPDRFFSTLEGYNAFNVPPLYITHQMMLGNTFRLARNFYMLSGILYGIQLGVNGNRWGIGEREGFIYNPKPDVSIVVWNQYFHSLTVYYPVMFPGAESGTAIRLPATPEVFSFGLQANFTVGEFIIGVGTSVTTPRKKHQR